MGMAVGGIETIVAGVSTFNTNMLQSRPSLRQGQWVEWLCVCANSSQVDQYTNMTKKIGLYVTTIFKNENDVMKAIEYLSIPTNELPDDLATVATTAANSSWVKSG